MEGLYSSIAQGGIGTAALLFALYIFKTCMTSMKSIADSSKEITKVIAETLEKYDESQREMFSEMKEEMKSSKDIVMAIADTLEKHNESQREMLCEMKEFNRQTLNEIKDLISAYSKRSNN